MIAPTGQTARQSPQNSQASGASPFATTWVKPPAIATESVRRRPLRNGTDLAARTSPKMLTRWPRDGGTTNSGTTNSGTTGSGTQNQGGDPGGPSGVSGGEFNIPPPPAPWTNPMGDIGPKLYAAPFADPGTAIYWPVRGKGKNGRAVAYIGTDGKGYGVDLGKGKWGAGGRNFLTGRSDGRCHVGIDVFGDYNDLVVAIENGTLKNWYHFYHGVNCLIVQCDSGLVINYGEVDPGGLAEFKLKMESRVVAGQPIGRVGRMTGGSSMLHFETYPSGTTNNQRHYKADPDSHLKSTFRDPTQYLLSLAKNGK